MEKGLATFSLDYGTCPKWLFDRMANLGQKITEVLISEYGPEEYIKRIANPVWFQCLGTVLAFDWNSSGLTTLLTAALKEGIKGSEKRLGIYICGGKGATSRKTPQQIEHWGNTLSLSDNTIRNLIYNSKTSAKVDSSLIQDGYNLYHHAFFFTKNGNWTVIQQGMNPQTQTARRYDWHASKNLIIEPHTAIMSQGIFSKSTLNLTSINSSENRNISTELVNNNFKNLYKDLKLLDKYASNTTNMLSLEFNDVKYTAANFSKIEFKKHKVENENFSKSKYLEKIFRILNEKKPNSYEKLLNTQGVGPKTIRALSLVAELIYGAKTSYQDPAKYSFAHGGIDATPYEVDRETYDNTIEIMKKAVIKTKLNKTEKIKIVNNLNNKSNI